MTTTSPMSVRLPVDMKKKLSDIAKSANRSTSFFMQEAVKNYIELHDWHVAGLKQAIKQMDNKEGIDGDIAMEWFDSLQTDNELTMPTA